MKVLAAGNARVRTLGAGPDTSPAQAIVVEGGAAAPTEYDTIAELVTASEASLAPGYYRVETVPPVIAHWDGTRFSQELIPPWNPITVNGAEWTKQTVFSGTQPAAATQHSIRPFLTRITPATLTDFADVLTTLHAHFASNSPYHEVLLVAAGGAANGFVVAPKINKFRPWCAVFRRTAAGTCQVGIQTLHAGAAITAVGDTTTPPTGTNADFQSVEWGVPSASTSIWINEHPDHFFVLGQTTSGDPGYDKSIAVGRGYQPHNASDYWAGRDGLYLLTGLPSHLSNAAYWFATTSASRIHMGDGLWTASGEIDSPGLTAMDSDATTGHVSAYRPSSKFMANNGVRLGLLTYIRARQTVVAFSGRFTVWTLDATKKDAWLCVAQGTGNGRTFIPWVKEVEP